MDFNNPSQLQRRTVWSRRLPYIAIGWVLDVSCLCALVTRAIAFTSFTGE